MTKIVLQLRIVTRVTPAVSDLRHCTGTTQIASHNALDINAVSFASRFLKSVNKWFFPAW